MFHVGWVGWFGSLFLFVQGVSSKNGRHRNVIGSIIVRIIAIAAMMKKASKNRLDRPIVCPCAEPFSTLTHLSKRPSFLLPLLLPFNYRRHDQYR